MAVRQALAFSVAVIAFSLSLGAAPQSGTAPDWNQPAGQYYKNVKVLKDVTRAQFIDAMRLMNDSLGVTCSHCHVTVQQGSWPMEKDDKKAKVTAREMIVMTQAINNQYFDGKLEVTCATCHQGLGHPASIPPIRALGQRPGGENLRPADGTLTADDVLTRYTEQIGGKAAMEKLSTRLAKGSVTNEQGRTFPLEVQQKAPNKYLALTTLPRGSQTQGFNGTSAWGANPGNISDVYGVELERLRRAAEFFAGTDVKTRYARLSVAGIDRIGDSDAVVLDARGPADVRERLFFDRTNGLLLRRIVYRRTILGQFPEQTDYSDYKEVDGVKLPFTVRRLEVNTRWTEKFEDIRHNVAVDEAKFEKPKS